MLSFILNILICVSIYETNVDSPSYALLLVTGGFFEQNRRQPENRTDK